MPFTRAVRPHDGARARADRAFAVATTSLRSLAGVGRRPSAQEAAVGRGRTATDRAPVPASQDPRDDAAPHGAVPSVACRDRTFRGRRGPGNGGHAERVRAGSLVPRRQRSHHPRARAERLACDRAAIPGLLRRAAGSQRATGDRTAARPQEHRRVRRRRSRGRERRRLRRAHEGLRGPRGRRLAAGARPHGVPLRRRVGPATRGCRRRHGRLPRRVSRAPRATREGAAARGPAPDPRAHPRGDRRRRSLLRRRRSLQRDRARDVLPADAAEVGCDPGFGSDHGRERQPRLHDADQGRPRRLGKRRSRSSIRCSCSIALTEERTRGVHRT